MRDEQFTELVNLYLDKEISAEELKTLEVEIAASPDRKRAFADRCRLHKAMRLALKPDIEQTSRSRSRSRSRRSSRRSRSRSRRVTRISEYEEAARAPSGSGLPRWLLASGMAAAAMLGLALLYPVFQNTTDPGAQPDLVGVTKKELLEKDPLNALGRSGLRRFAAAQEQREAHSHASLVSQMRLMGLRPEFTPVDKKLTEVDLAAVYQPKKQVSQAELFQRVQGLKSMPEQNFLRVESLDAAAVDWSGVTGPAVLEVEDKPEAIRF